MGVGLGPRDEGHKIEIEARRLMAVILQWVGGNCKSRSTSQLLVAY